MSRLTLLHINIIGVVVALIVAGGLYFTIITGAIDARTKAESDLKGVKDREAQFGTHEAMLAKANRDKVEAEKNYALYKRDYIPVIGYKTNRLDTMRYVFWPNNGKSWPERFRRTLSAYMNGERRRNGVVWLNPEVTAMGPFGPNPNTIDAGRQGEQLGPVLHYDYQMQVRAPSMSALNRHLRNWPSIRKAGVPTINGLQVTGNSPSLQATYNLTLTIIVEEPIPALDGRLGGTSSGGGGGGGGRGGFGGGVSPGGGGPGGGFPGSGAMGPMMGGGGASGGGGGGATQGRPSIGGVSSGG
jgi:hypothetical protein